MSRQAFLLVIFGLLLASAAAGRIKRQFRDDDDGDDDETTVLTTVATTVAETTVAETTVEETTVAETAVAETTVLETTVAETTIAETTVAETTVTETTVEETTVAETTVAETTAAETTVAETTVEETTVAETTVAETTVEETTVAETTVSETTVAETTAAETTVAETTVAETTFAETTIAETTVAPTTEKPDDGTDFQTTVIFLRKETDYGEEIFIRGGVGGGTTCTNGDPASDPCAIPIEHLDLGIDEDTSNKDYYAVGDNYLSWSEYPENGQTSTAEGTPAQWTTSDASQDYFSEFNKYGEHYWLVYVDMDCSVLQDGLFEFKGVLNNVWENDISSSDCGGDGAISVTFPSSNHVGRCGYINVFSWGSSTCTIESF